MNPVLGVGPTSKAAATLFTLLHLTHAQFLGPDSGNVGEYKHFFILFNSIGVKPCQFFSNWSMEWSLVDKFVTHFKRKKKKPKENLFN